MTEQPKVLLLGDSIRMSYQPLVAKRLKDVADVVGPEDNCQFALFTLASLERWLNELGNPDVVHWNNGIHDSGHNPGRTPRQIPIEIYRMTLEYVLQRLQATGAKIVWGTITPVHPNRPFTDEAWAWKNDEIDAYNETALELMKAQDIPINDLHGLVLANVDTFLADDMLHLSDEGRAACADAVAEAVRPYLAP